MDISLNITGDVCDKIIYNDGKIETIYSHNTVMNCATNLITSLIGNKDVGLKYWAIGSGIDSWDTSSVNPSPNEVKLTNEIGRKAIDSIEFVDTTGNTSQTPTNRIKVMTSFDIDECNGKWREFGIFGGNSASITKDSGIMFDKKHHGVYEKTNKMAIERTIIFTITLA